MVVAWIKRNTPACAFTSGINFSLHITPAGCWQICANICFDEVVFEVLFFEIPNMKRKNKNLNSQGPSSILFQYGLAT